MELIVVMVIIGVLTVIAVLNYNTMMVQGSANAAQKNLIAIYNAQKSNYFNNGSYCTAACNSQASINATLALNISDNYFTYTCSNASGFTCTATNNGDSNLILTITGGTANNPIPIVLPGGTGCKAYPWAAPCNPSCVSDRSIYCPSS